MGPSALDAVDLLIRGRVLAHRPSAGKRGHRGQMVPGGTWEPTRRPKVRVLCGNSLNLCFASSIASFCSALAHTIQTMHYGALVMVTGNVPPLLRSSSITCTSD